jgi:uncharacterized protein YicC (UPF0701 family)
MTALPLTHPTTIRVNRTELRENLRKTLDRAKGCTVVAISANDHEGEKLLLDRKYFDEMVKSLKSLMETIEITTDRKLFEQIVRAASTLEEDTRLGKLHSFAEAFGED